MLRLISPLIIAIFTRYATKNELAQATPYRNQVGMYYLVILGAILLGAIVGIILGAGEHSFDSIIITLSIIGYIRAYQKYISKPTKVG